MVDLLSTLGSKLAERWISLLALPGALYLAVAVAAHTLGHRHAFAVRQLTVQVDAWAKAPAAHTLGGQVVLLAAVLAGSAVVGLAAHALGSTVERVYLAADWLAWPSPLRRLAGRRVARRQVRWDAAAGVVRQGLGATIGAAVRNERRPQPDAAALDAARRAMDRIAAERPVRPTWSGDRIHAAAVRLDRDHHLDLATVWPALWLMLPDTARTEITDARQALTRATGLYAWALFYLPLSVWWWPAAPVAAVLAVIGRIRTRAATETYALLVEAAVRVHAAELARSLGLDVPATLTQAVGDALTRLLATSPVTPADPTPAGGATQGIPRSRR
ncbi:hypothetical protein ACIRBY_15635 [Streptomyces sp. NPDC096136]|uniref:hypothetical protein n=1 Tax=Streptomyces sp. NPDC096136 TaxID=3366076 RepID=UPI00381DBDA9